MYEILKKYNLNKKVITGNKIKKYMRSNVEILNECQERSISFKRPYPSTLLIRQDNSTLPVGSPALAHGHTGENASFEVTALTELLPCVTSVWERGKEQERGPDFKMSTYFQREKASPRE